MPVPDPVTRKEMYLNKAATGSGSIPAAPVTREEMYLAEIDNGGGGGGGVLMVNVIKTGGVNSGVDKTYDEIKTHIDNGGIALIDLKPGTCPPSLIYYYSPHVKSQALGVWGNPGQGYKLAVCDWRMSNDGASVFNETTYSLTKV